MGRTPQAFRPADRQNGSKSNKHVPHDKAASMANLLLQLHGWIRSVLPDRDDDRGASLVEYALLLALIFVVCVVSVGVIGGSTSGGLEGAGSSGFAGP